MPSFTRRAVPPCIKPRHPELRSAFANWLYIVLTHYRPAISFSFVAHGTAFGFGASRFGRFAHSCINEDDWRGSYRSVNSGRFLSREVSDQERFVFSYGKNFFTKYETRAHVKLYRRPTSASVRVLSETKRFATSRCMFGGNGACFISHQTPQ